MTVFALFFRPHPGGFDSSRVSTPGNLPSKAKKMLMPGGQPRKGGGGWAKVELIDALCGSNTYSTNSASFVTGIMRLFRSNCPREVQKRISLEAVILCRNSEARFSNTARER